MLKCIQIVFIWPSLSFGERNETKILACYILVFYGRSFSRQEINTHLVSNLYPTFVCAAIVSGGKGTAQDKIKTLREAGVTVVESPAKMGVAMVEAFKQKGLVN